MTSRRTATTAASGLGLLLVPILLSARPAERHAATEPPAPTTSPTSSVPATIVSVEPSTTTTGVSPTPPSTAAPATTPEPGGTDSTPPGTAQIDVDVAYCVTPWGDIEPAWCSTRVELWRRADGTCWVTPAGVAAGRVCPDRETDDNDQRLPETAAGSRWA